MTNLNKLIAGTEFADMPLEEIIRKSQGGMFNNAAQVWNHTFYWNCLKPDRRRRAGGKLAEAINKAFGELRKLQGRVHQDRHRHLRLRLGAGWCSARTARWRWSAPPTPPPR